MKITCRILNLGVVDESGEMFAKDCKFSFGDTVPVTDAGSRGLEGVQGMASIKHRDGYLEAELDIRDDSPSGKILAAIKEKNLPLKMYPAVNGFVMDRDDKTFKEVQINSIDISVGGNADRTIPPLKLTED